MITLISWIATFFTLWGAIKAAKKSKWCWPTYTVGSILWVVYATLTMQPALIVVNLIFIVVNLYGAYKWTTT